MSSLPGSARVADDAQDDPADAGARERRLLYSMATLLLSKVVSAFTALISLPLTLHYLGTERYGMWATMSSAIVLFNLADLGIGLGILNRVSSAYGRGDHDDIRRIGSSAALLLTGIAAGLLVLLGLAYPFVPWAAVFNVQSELARAEAGPAAALFIVFWSLGIPLSLVHRVQFGMQLGHVSNCWQIASSLAALAAILVATRFDAGVYLLVAAFAGMPALVTALNWMVFFYRRRPDVRPVFRSARAADAFPVMRTGLGFLILQLTGTVTIAADSFVIAQVLGAEAVTGFSIREKMFAVISMLVLVVSHSLWPAIAEANARGDIGWLRKTVTRALVFALALSVTLSTVLVVLGDEIVRLWIGGSVAAATGLLLAFGCWKVLESVGATIAIYLNARGIVRPQVILSCAYCVVAIALKFYLVRHVGVAGVVWATCIAYLAIVALPTFRITVQSLQRARLA